MEDKQAPGQISNTRPSSVPPRSTDPVGLVIELNEVIAAEQLQEVLGVGRRSLRNRLIGRVVSVFDTLDLDENSRQVNKTLVRDTIHQLVDDALLDCLFVLSDLAQQRKECCEEFERRFGSRLVSRRRPKTYRGSVEAVV